jgi:hypothetical protein
MQGATMPTDSRPAPVDVKISKVEGRACDDLATRKAVTEVIADAMAALFRARRRSFRIVTGNPAADGLVIEGVINAFDVGERTVNGQAVSFRIGIGAKARGGRLVAERHFGWPDCPVDPSQRFPAWAAGVVADCVRREAPRFVDDCEGWLERSRR